MTDTTLLNNIISNIDYLIPQVSDFLGQLDNLITVNKINLVTDGCGLSIDVPNTMSEQEAAMLSKRVGIIDRLIYDRSDNIKDLFRQGLSIEENLKKANPQYTSQLSGRMDTFKHIADKYRH
jgi:hypothetical protein